MSWKLGLAVALVGAAGLCMYQAFTPADVAADAGDGNQVYSHSILANTIDSTEVIDDGLTAADINWPNFCGMDSLEATGDTTQVTCAYATSDYTTSAIILTPQTVTVGRLYVKTRWDGGFTMSSSGNETSDVYVNWMVVPID